MNLTRLLVGCVFCLLITGCTTETTQEDVELRSLPVVQGSDLEQFVRSSNLPVLVEFGVDYQCERCARMRNDIVELGERLRGKGQVVRVDFNANAPLVAKLGGTICPTYVLFQDGEPVLTESFPVSADILEAQLDQL